MATTIKIGHASISEDRTAYGEAGDSTGFEVCTVDNYNITELNPHVVLRPKTTTLAELSAKACEVGCANNNIGYSQNGRNTLYNLVKDNEYDLANVGLCNTDCSAFMTVCAIAGGSKIAYGSNAPTTTNMRTRFKQSGDYTVLTDSKHLTKTDYLKRGDILVHEGSHTVMVLENGSSVIDDPAESDDSTGITPITILKIRDINITIANVSASAAEVAIKITEQKTGDVAKVLSDSTLKKYKWSYILEQPGGASVKKQLKLASGQLKLLLRDLTPESSYMLRVIAKKDGDEAFCSPRVLFTTLPSKQAPGQPKQAFTRDDIEAIDTIYIKINNKYKRAIAYTNTQEVD
jgi:hypothetical protein